MSANQNIKPLTTCRNAAGNLEISGCDMVNWAAQYGTPLYVMDQNTLETIAREYRAAFAGYKNRVNMMFASKALTVGPIARILRDNGFGFDVVSGGEIYKLHNAGIDLRTATFNGNNKTRDEIELALRLNIGHVSVDNFWEMQILNEIAAEQNIIQPIWLRITPGIECHTHEYIQTGHLDSKFGFDLIQLDDAIENILNNCQNLKIMGLHAHIGSQIFETQVFADEVAVVIQALRHIRDKFGLELNEVNLGGGLGITYVDSDCPPSINEIADVIMNAVYENCDKYNIEIPALYLEPGRSLVGTAGITLYTVGSYKQVPNGGRKYIAVDGGMADNPRPAMYGALYTADIANKTDAPMHKVTIAGRFCESGDIVIYDTELPSPKSGDVLCVYNTGAYCYSMSSNYNSVCRPAMVLINNGAARLIVKRETYEQLVQNEVLE